MENYIMLNGNKVPLTDEQVSALLGGKETEYEKVDTFERKMLRRYFYIGNNGEVLDDNDNMGITDGERYNAGNYCRDKEMMNQRAMHEALNRLLWRYSEQHGGDNEWDNETRHYFISIKRGNEPYVNGFTYSQPFGVVFFKDEETAKSAIHDVVKPFLAEHPEFVW